MKSNSYFILLLTIVVLFAAWGCGAGGGETENSNQQNVTVNPNPVIPPSDPNADKLNSGKLVKGTVKEDCDNSVVLDEVNKLCELFKIVKGDGSDACINQVSHCNDYGRQIYSGSVLGQGPKSATWNARGGSGALMADAAVCTLRELSTKVPGGGPIKSSASLNIGIGDVVVKQEVGYLDFDRIYGRFKGYRNLRVELPVIGKFNAVTQDIDVGRVFYSTGQLFNEIPKAGGYPLLFAYGLNFYTQEKDKSIDIDPGSFNVTTPIGVFQVSPHFGYESNTVVADSPFVTDYTYIDLGKDAWDQTPAAIKLSDLYGVIPGIYNNASPLPNDSNYKVLRTGWVSQLGLGTRGALDDKLWTPPTGGFFSRPDYDPSGVNKFQTDAYKARSEEENRPSVYAGASATIKYPEHPSEMLPDWVDSLPGLDWDAYIKVTPTIKAGAAGQFGLLISEGTDNQRDLKEFGAHPESRISALGIYSGVEVNASFEVLAELRLYVSADFGWPIDRIDMIDIHPKFPIPIAGGTPSSSNVELAAAYSTSDNSVVLPETLDHLKTFKGVKNPEEFINICYAKEAEVPPEEPPKSEPEKGDVTDLFEYLPCNICLATDAVINPNTGAVKEPAHKEILSPVNPTPPAVWQCDAASKSGCMDLCKLNKETGQFTVVKNPSQIADSIPATDPDYNKLYPFYKSCMISCEGVTSPVNLGGITACKGLDSTPPSIFGIMVPGGGGGTPAPVPVGTNIAASFSEPMDPVSVNTSTFTVSDSDGNEIAGEVNYDGTTYRATFTPSRQFDYNRTYTATITTGVTDFAGNPLPADVSWTFTTEALPDTVPPFVTVTNPDSDAIDVEINSNIRARFSEAINGSTIHAGTFTVSNGVTGTITYDEVTMTAVFTPFAPLAGATFYTATISTGIEDLAGNPMANDYTWNFETAAAPDVTPPAVSSTNPAPNATDVPLDATVSVTFTEPVDTSTVTDATFTLSYGRGGNVAGTIYYTDGGSTAVFTPAAPLNYDNTYTATITTGVKDLAGNPMASDYSWNFTTVSAPLAEERTAFVTSVQGNGNLSTWADAVAEGKTGLAAGDAVCQARATAAGLSGNFVAWLSDYNNDAYCRVHNLTGKKSANCGQGSLPADAGPWVRTDGFPFSEVIDQLVNDGKVFAPVMYDEFGNPVGFSEKYLTGTNADGTYDATGSTYTCYDWTSTSLIASAIGGRTDGATYSWTHNYSETCDSSSWRLLCLETGTGVALPPYVTVGKKVFVTSSSGTGDLGTWPGAGANRGIAAGDAICQAEAAEAGLANSANFKAWLSSYLSGTVVNARDRLTSNGPWVRPDGVKVADNKADLTDGSLFTAISQTETGTYLSPSVTAWTGTYTDGTYNSVTSTCEGWTTSTPPNDSNARIGESSLNDANWTGVGYSPCSASRHLYCFEDQ